LIQSGPLGDAVGSICNWCAQNNQFEIVREIEEYVLSTQQKLEDITAISYAILDTHDYTDQGCDVNIDSLEVFFDASSQTAGMPLLIIYVEKIFQRIAELEQGAAWANGTPQAFAGYIGLRFMSSSKGLIAMQRWAYTCSMEIAGFNKVDSTKPFLTQIEKDALALGGTVHWGQRNDLTSAAVASIFDTGSSSHLRRWRQALSRFSGNGRLPCFSTDFTRQRGLEVVQPTIEGFTVTPAAAPTGTLATVTWLSGDAPGPTLAGPGTTATLTIAPGGYHMPLATVDGSLTVPIPAGLSSFILDLSYTLNSHTFTATRTVQVQGT
jgi:hypothetical protein